MVNELGISREDIKEWTMQAVKETIEKELRGFSVESAAEEYVRSIIRSDSCSSTDRAIERAFTNTLTKNFIQENLVISLKLKEGK
jgi:hypothetical protein